MTMNVRKILLLTSGTIILAAAAFLRPLGFIDNLWYDLHFSFAAADASDSEEPDIEVPEEKKE